MVCNPNPERKSEKAIIKRVKLVTIINKPGAIDKTVIKPKSCTMRPLAEAPPLPDTRSIKLLPLVCAQASPAPKNNSAQITIANDDVSPIAYDSFGDDCELEMHDGESNIECLVEIPILEPNACCLGQKNIEEIPIIYDLDPPSDILTLTDESQVDFIGFSKYFGAIEDNCEEIELEPTMCYIETCFSKSLLIERSCKSCVNEFPLSLEPCLLRRNKDKVILVFDTYD